LSDNYSESIGAKGDSDVFQNEGLLDRTERAAISVNAIQELHFEKCQNRHHQPQY